MKLGFDIDDTIADSFSLMFNLAQKFDIEVLGKEGEINTENVKEGFYIGNIHSWKKEQTEAFFELYYVYALQKVKPKIFSVDVLQKLKKEGNEIIIISSRFNNKTVSNINRMTKEWLERYKIPYDKLYTEAQNKIEIIKNEKIEIVVDDDYYICKEASKFTKKVFLMNLQSNVNKQTNENIKRIYSWIQLYQNIKEIGKW